MSPGRRPNAGSVHGVKERLVLDPAERKAALLSVIGMEETQRELTTFARDKMSDNVNPTPLIVAALMYLIVTIPLTQVVAWLERRQQRAR